MYYLILIYTSYCGYFLIKGESMQYGVGYGVG